MPGIDYAQVRAVISMADALRLLDFHAAETSGDELRGPCPIHGSISNQSRSFSANIRKNTFQCFKCGAKGNQLDLWVAITKRPLYAAAFDLCEKCRIEVPYLTRDNRLRREE